MRRRRWRTVVLWGGCTLCVLIVATFVVSGWWEVNVGTLDGLCVYLRHGAIMVDMHGPDDALIAYPNSSWEIGLWNGWGAGSYFLDLPLYAVFLTVAIPTLLVWRFVPKPVRPGCCRCGYDLTGNTSGKCPECGVEVQA